MLGLGIDLPRYLILEGLLGGYPLDNYTDGLSGLYALERMLGSYDGPLVRIRRSSDNVEESFYALNNGSFPTGELTRFLSPWDNPTPDIGTYYYSFNGVDSEINWTGNTVSNASEFSVSFWFRQPTTPVFSSNIPHICKLQASTGAGFRIFFGSGTYGDIVAGFEGGSVAQRQMGALPGGWSSFINEWHHCVVTYNGAAVSAIYVDGSSLTLSAAGLLSSFGNNNSIGQIAAGNTSFPFDGDLTEFVVYNSELSATDVGKLYNVGLGGVQSEVQIPGAILYYKGDETAEPILDQSSGGRNASSVTNITFESPTIPFIDRTTLRWPTGNTGEQVRFTGIGSSLIDFTVSFWAKVPSNTDYQYFFGNSLLSTSLRGLAIRTTTAVAPLDPLELYYYDGAIKPLNAFFSGYNEWNHVMLVHDSVARTLTAYVNGVSGGAVAAVPDVITTLSNRAGSNEMDGNMAEFAIWSGYKGDVNDALALYNGGIPVDADSVIASPNRYYRLNETSGTTAVDSGTDGEDGILTNFGTEDGFVTIWYDQSGNDFHVYQTTAANQPKLVSAGTLVTIGSKAAIDFDGSTGRLESAGNIGITGSSSRNTTFIIERDASSSTDSVFGWGVFSTAQSYSITTELAYRCSSVTKLYTTNSLPTQGSPELVFGDGNGVNLDAYSLAINGINIAEDTTTAGTTTLNTADTKFMIGAVPGNPSLLLDGRLQFLAIWSSSQEANKFGIESALNDGYSIYTLDADATAYITAAGITDTTEKQAVYQLVADLKGVGATPNGSDLWTKSYAIYGYSPTSLAAASVNIKNPGTFDITWSGTVNHAAVGTSTDGATGYGDTGFNPITEGITTSGGIGQTIDVTRTTGSYYMGCFSGNYSAIRYNGQFILYQGSTSSSIATGSSASPAIVTSSRRGATDFEGYVNGVSSGTSVFDETATVLPNHNYYLHALNNNGSPDSFVGGTFRFAAIHQGLTDNEAADLADAIARYNANVVSGGR